MKIFKKLGKKEENNMNSSRDAAKERLHLVLMQDRANVSADFLELMKQEIIDVIKKYIDVDENEIDVRLTNKENSDGTNGAPALYANIPILNIKNEARKKVKVDGQDTNDNNVKAEKLNEVNENTKRDNKDVEIKNNKNDKNNKSNKSNKSDRIDKSNKINKDKNNVNVKKDDLIDKVETSRVNDSNQANSKKMKI